MRYHGKWLHMSFSFPMTLVPEEVLQECKVQGLLLYAICLLYTHTKELHLALSQARWMWAQHSDKGVPLVTFDVCDIYAQDIKMLPRSG